MIYNIHKQYEIEQETKTIVVPTSEMYKQLLYLTPVLLEQKTAKQVSLLYCIILQGISDVDANIVDRFLNNMMCDKDRETFLSMLEDVNNIMTGILAIQLERLLKVDKKKALEILKGGE